MLFACNRKVVAAATLLLWSVSNATTSTRTPAPKTPSATNTPPATCEFRTINYITDSLPQQCLKSSWSHSNATISTVSEGVVNASAVEEITTIPSSHESNPSDAVGSDSPVSATSSYSVSTTSNPPPSGTETGASEDSPTDIESGELNEASFLSFEDWKKQTLEKAGQANANIGHKRSGGAKRDSESIQNNLDSLGDEEEIELDFRAFRGGSGEEPFHSTEAIEPEPQASRALEGGRRKDHRSKDAGITCKERFSYASFDAGATILKTHTGAKNSKAVLIENKDSYMLSECSTNNKFLIVELSEDIWIDTVVLANYEFFSSMIRTFRVSVSDKYPVKMEKWKDLGVYEARNSREIQAFLIENPQIWARYLRIEFLSHYGNEYYCPLSLLRVHGTRMLESWRETEAGGDEDETEEIEENEEEQYEPEAVSEIVKEKEKLNVELTGAQAAIDGLAKTAASVLESLDPALGSSHLAEVNRSLEDIATGQNSTPWIKPELALFNASMETQDFGMCLPVELPIRSASATMHPEPETTSASQPEAKKSAATPPSASSDIKTSPLNAPASTSDKGATNPQPSSVIAASNITSMTSSIKDSLSSKIASVANKTSSAPSGGVTKGYNATASQKNKTSTSTASSALPTIQESFFKAVSRRLQLLETNSTLSLKYIEEQSKILREAFTKVEKKQLQKTNSFLDTLNSTVLAELRGFRQQYDEIWQSTIISLESQREESRREILAISARLNILADEVVFQKRMSIVQSVLLLLCLGLVIFSRVSAGGHLDFPAMQARARNFGFSLSPLESPLASPPYRRNGSVREDQQWLEPEQRGNGSPVSRPRTGDDNSPPTPVSFYSRSENALTPPSGGDELNGSTGDLMGDHLEVPSSSDLKDTSSYHAQEGSNEQCFESFPTVRAPRKRKAFMRRQSGRSFDDGQLPTGETQGLGIVEYGVDEHPASTTVNSSPPLPSHPSDKERPNFSIARKPLPALPQDRK